LGLVLLRLPAHGTTLPVFARSHACRCLLRTWLHVRTREPCFEALQCPHGWSASIDLGNSENDLVRNARKLSCFRDAKMKYSFANMKSATHDSDIRCLWRSSSVELAGMTVRSRPRGAETLATPRFGRF